MNIHVGATAWRIDTKKDTPIPLDAATMKGIFEIQRHATDRSQDSLRWCFALPGQKRPTSFEVEKGSRHTLVCLKRFVLNESKFVEALQRAGATVYKDHDGGWVNEVVLPDSFDTKIAKEALPHLQKLSSVVSYVSDTHLVEALVGHTTLRSLRMRCQVDAEILAQLASGLPKLSTLGFRCKDFSEAHSHAVAKGKVNWLQITGAQNGIQNLKFLKDQPIGRLTMTECHLNKENVSSIAKQMQRVYFLDIKNCTLRDPDTLSAIGQMKGMKNLNLEGDSITDQQLLSIQSNPKIHIMDVSGTSITIESLKHIAKNFPRVFSVRAEKIPFDKQLFDIVNWIESDRQFYVTITEGAVRRSVVQAKGQEFSRRLHVNR